MDQLYSSVNGLPIAVPQIVSEVSDAQGQLNSRFYGGTSTEGGQLFLTKPELKERDNRAAGTATFGGYENAEFLESKIQKGARSSETPVTYKPAKSAE